MHIRKRKGNISNLALTLVGIIALCFAMQAAAQDADPEQTTGVIGTPVTTPICDPAQSDPPAGADTTYRIVSEESNAQYEVEEEIVSIGANTAVGKTNAFIGTFFFDSDGAPLPCSRWDVDLRTLQSDDPRRDNYLYGNTLETETYPLATFILTSVPDMPLPVQEDVETELTLVGDLTVHGVTRVIAWQAVFTVTPEGMTGTAETTFQMPDFDITPPVNAAVLSVDENVTLHVDIVATQD